MKTTKLYIFPYESGGFSCGLSVVPDMTSKATGRGRLKEIDGAI